MIIRSVKDLGALVRERRSQLGWSQDELASQVGVGRLWVTQFEAGKTTSHIGLVLRTLKALGLNVSVDHNDTTPKGTDFIDIDEIIAPQTREGESRPGDDTPTDGTAPKE